MVGLKHKCGKVPVGATHYEPESEEFVEGWMKKDKTGAGTGGISNLIAGRFPNA